ncbi:hypothetical protein [Burkholderia multivorans]|uniref:hypothetical protein n=1 Tax=Burkholderia multivorans TaxID=87883 RepID=UPI0012D2E47C|nr:hypothetical protein [Burkholderia multivorans]
MTLAIAICSSIEAEQIALKTRQFFPGPPSINKSTGEKRWHFSLGINSSAWITKAYSTMDEVVYSTSMLALGDKVQGGGIDGWTRKPLGRDRVKKGSGTHSATFLTVSGGCYAHIESPERAHLNSPEISKKVAPIEQIERAPAAATGTTGE